MQTREEIIKEFSELFELKEKEIEIYQKMVDSGCEPDLASLLAEEEYNHRKSFLHHKIEEERERVREWAEKEIRAHSNSNAMECARGHCKKVLDDLTAFLKEEITTPKQ